MKTSQTIIATSALIITVAAFVTGQYITGCLAIVVASAVIVGGKK